MLDVCALGGSISTGMNQFIKGDVLEVKSLDEVNNLPDSLVKGKIIFYNRPMDPKKGLQSFLSHDLVLINAIQEP